VASHFADTPYKSVGKGGVGMFKSVIKRGPMKTSSQLASENAKSEEADELRKSTS
jgi:hypothetical protein